jgi:hypothetical protein
MNGYAETLAEGPVYSVKLNPVCPMPLDAFPAFLMHAGVEHTQDTVAMLGTLLREPGPNLELIHVSENHCATSMALDPVRDLGEGLKNPKKEPSRKIRTSPVVGAGMIDCVGKRFLTIEETRGG